MAVLESPEPGLVRQDLVNMSTRAVDVAGGDSALAVWHGRGRPRAWVDSQLSL